MADLQQIVGALLRDLTKARFSSDIYSRSIARYYENDPLLRRFPVPRADIEEIDIQLKFSILGIETNDINTEGREANIAFILERSVEKLISTYLDLAAQFVSEPENEATRQGLYDTLDKGFRSSSLRVALRQTAFQYLIESYPHLINADGKLDTETIIRDIQYPFIWAHLRFLKSGADTTTARKYITTVIEHAFNHNDFKRIIDGLSSTISDIWKSNYDASLIVELDGHKLAQMNDLAVSSLHIKMQIKNSVWNEVKVAEHQYQRTLTPE